MRHSSTAGVLGPPLTDIVRAADAAAAASARAPGLWRAAAHAHGSGAVHDEKLVHLCLPLRGQVEGHDEEGGGRGGCAGSADTA